MKTLVKTNGRPHLSDAYFNNNWMDDFFGENLPETNHFSPQADILENETSFLITISLPGMTKKDIKLDLMDNKLTVSGESQNETKKEGEKFISREIVKGSFHREFRLGNHIDIEKIDAAFNNGLLNITLPKSEKANPKTISIK
jgi:HSP20 family protein